MNRYLMGRMSRACRGLWCLALCCYLLPMGMAHAAMAVLEFELNDLTLLPATPTELERTHSARPALTSALQAAGHTIIPVDPTVQERANEGFGYLFTHPEKVAALGKTLGADQVIVGRVHKPSFLFAYLLVQVVDVQTGKVTAEFNVEAKGESLQTTKRALDKLAALISGTVPAPVTSSAPAAATFTAPIYQQTSTKPFDDVIADLLFAISQNNFRLTEHARIGSAIAEREQIPFPAVTVLHFCNLTYAKALIESKAASLLHMPCRIAIRQVDGKVIIETLLLPEQADTNPTLAADINKILKNIVNTGAS